MQSLKGLLGRKNEEIAVKTMGRKIRTIKGTYHHDVLKGILNSPLIISEREKIRNLLKEPHVTTFFIPASELGGTTSEIKTEILKDTTKKRLEKILNRPVLIEDIGLGVLMAFKKPPEEDLSEIRRVVANLKTKTGVEKHLTKALRNPLSEEKAAEILKKIPRKGARITGRKLVRITEAIHRGRRQGISFASRVRKPKPI